MQLSVRIMLSVLLLVSTIASSQPESIKLRRDGILNLYPFPRVGRASKETWIRPSENQYMDRTQKRSLMAFPRVGRNDLLLALNTLQDYQSKRNQQHEAKIRSLLQLLEPKDMNYVKREGESNDSEGMWFGPRLGRSLKDNNDGFALEQIEKSEQEQEAVQTRKKR